MIELQGGQWGIGWNRTRTNQKDECTGHLFSAHVHYVIGNKNGWFLVSLLPNAIVFFARLNTTVLGFEVKVLKFQQI